MMSSSNEDGTARQASTADGGGAVPGARPKGRPGRKPKGTVPAVVTELPERPDPGHVLTWRQRKVLQVIRESVQRRGYPRCRARDTCAAMPAGPALLRSACPGIRPSGPSRGTRTRPR